MAVVCKPFGDIITFERASSATFFDASGTLQTATTDVPRFDYNLATLAAQGLLIEEARTNSIRNNTMQGASAGVSPTNWTGSGVTANGMTVNVQGTGTENGIQYVDFEITGTATVTGTAITFSFEGPGIISASPSQVWAWSSYLKFVSGSLTNLTLNGRIQWRDSIAAIGSADSSALTPTTADLATQRQSYTGTAIASTAFVQPQLRIGTVNGVTYNAVIRIGMPQLELGAFATSVIPTTTEAATRAADKASVNTLSPWFNSASGTLYVEGQIASGIGSEPAVLTGLDDTTINNRMQLRRQSPGTVGDFRFVSSGGNFTGTATVGTLTGINKQAAAYAVSDQAGVVNGTLITGITPVATLPTITRLAFGDGQGSTNINGWLRRVTFYPRRLSNAELQAITA